MFTFAIILAVASTAFELMLAAKIPAWRRLSHKSLVFNLGNSMVLSWLTGLMFGAAGLIAMTAGIFSTIMSIPGYAFLHWCYDSDEAKARGGNQFAYYSTKIREVKAKWSQTIADFFELIYKIIRALTWPIRFTRTCTIKINAIRARLAR